MTIKFELQGIPLPMNKIMRLHYHARNKYVKGWYNYVALATSKLRPKEPFRYAKLTMIQVLPPKNKRDYDGLVASLKPIVDGLVHAHIIADDTYDVTGPWHVQQVTDKSAKLGRIEIKVEDMTQTFTGTLNPPEFL